MKLLPPVLNGAGVWSAISTISHLALEQCTRGFQGITELQAEFSQYSEQVGADIVLKSKLIKTEHHRNNLQFIANIVYFVILIMLQFVMIITDDAAFRSLLTRAGHPCKIGHVNFQSFNSTKIDQIRNLIYGGGRQVVANLAKARSTWQCISAIYLIS
ncbi:hypothetical protein GQX74_009640 [Glossina fuscipes]|nr:hypothetical protein GQX74_009640 [Glossina fuscipes]